MSLSLPKPPKFVLTDDSWPDHLYSIPWLQRGPGMLRTQIPSAGLKTWWNSFYWSQPLLAVFSLPYKTGSITSVLPCTASDAIPASRKHHSSCPALPELPVLTTAAFPCRFLKPQTGCTAQDSQNLDAHLFPGSVLDAGPAVGAAAQGSHGVSRAGEAGVAPHR